MMFSTRGRYALRILVDLAEHQKDGYVPLKEIADRQEVSETYLESVSPAGAWKSLSQHLGVLS